MAEYLAPGVYVEEIPSANKPIQGASTSTAGMVGMTERGPVNTPTLVTSLGEFARKFGGALDPDLFKDGKDGLPYGAEGFFTNLGARLYVVRILGAARSNSMIPLLAADGTVTSPAKLAFGVNKDATTFQFVGGAGITAAYANTMLIADGDRSEVIALNAATALTTSALLSGGLTLALPISSATVLSKATVLTASEPGTLDKDTAVGTKIVTLAAASNIVANDFVLIHDAGNTDSNPEFGEVASIDATKKIITLKANVAAVHGKGTEIKKVAPSATSTTIKAAAAASSDPVLLSLTAYTNIAQGTALLLENGAGASTRVVVSDLVKLATLKAGSKMTNSYAAGTAITTGIPALNVHALSAGIWGDRLRISAGASALVKTVLSENAAAAATTINLTTAFGLFPGSVVVIGDPTAGATQTALVAAVNTATGQVTLAAPLGSAAAKDAMVTSQEFSISIERIDKVSGKVVESEFFDRLSLSADHPRNAFKMIGSCDLNGDNASESGGSQLVRLSVPTAAVAKTLPFVVGVRRFMSGGNDDVNGVNDQTYIGDANENPNQRTGIQALENEPGINIVAVPGRTSVLVQKALVDHCEKMRYRFAAVDVPLGSTLAQARAHRQNFDSTRVAVYYPGLMIANRFANPGDRMKIASSGHMLGVYARTDIQRGVHKAPANEVIQGILGLEVALTKGEQDMLNPINLNCHRDFRSENRGLRVYGARVATSDPEWKYINVRRLLLFIEQSLDNGLQWAVFEPNDQPLWDQVKQSITGFLETVWRSGALEGAVREEAFYVNIGYKVTMEQADIDNGRLIVEIGVAPVKPAEFVIVRISQKTREATS